MKLNINKEMLLKNRFWVVLGTSVCVILCGIFYLQFSVSAEDLLKKNQAQLAKSVGKKGPIENDENIRQRDLLAQKAGELEGKVWNAAFLEQEPLFIWPTRVEQEFEFRKGLFATAITVSKLTEPKDWPADVDGSLVHGQLLDARTDWIIIQDRKAQQMKIYTTKSVANVMFAEDSKLKPFGELVNHLKTKLVAVTYQRGRYFNEPLTESQQRTFAESYKAQVHEILKSVDPLDDKGKGVVQLRDWLYRPDEYPDNPKSTFIRFVNREWNTNIDNSKEAWIAQENLWIQREIYRIVRQTNDSVSKFVKQPGKKDAKVHVFKNFAFELQLSLNTDRVLSFTIKNRRPHKQKLDLSFRVFMNPTRDPELIRISAPALAAAGDKDGKDLFLTTFPSSKEVVRTEILNVEQVLSWESAAIKRIDHISIGSNAPDDMSHSHRTFPTGLRPLEAPEVPAGGVPPIPGGEGGMPLPGGPRPGPGAGVGGGNQGVFEKGQLLWTHRYSEVTRQSRRVPVCVVFIVDQAQVDRILTEFTNSKLRFLTTQVLLNHYTASLMPPAAGDKQDPGFGNPFQPPPIFRPPGVFGPGVGAGPAPAAGGGNRLDSNMELVIYGIMTLYERYPPRPQAEKKQ